MTQIIITGEMPKVLDFGAIHQIFKMYLLETVTTSVLCDEVTENYMAGFLTKNEYHAQSVHSYLVEYECVEILFVSVQQRVQVGGSIETRSTIQNITPKGVMTAPTIENEMIRSILYGLYQLPHNWVADCFDNNQHLIEKHKHISRQTSQQPMADLRFFFELSEIGQNKMIEYLLKK